jgi:hypothetical protein
MPRSFAVAAPVCQVNTDSRAELGQGKEHSLVLALLREAIATSGWKHEALALEMALPNAAYLSRMLSGEKPVTLRHLSALPDDIERIYYRLRSESLGLIAVEPPPTLDVALRQMAAGLIGIATLSRMPARASSQAKATLDSTKRRSL